MNALPSELATLVDLVGRLRSRLAALPSALQLSEPEIGELFARAYNQLSQGRHEDARRIFALLSLARPLEPKVLVGLAVSYQMLGRYAEAIQVYAFAGCIEPRRPEHTLSIAECELLLGQPGPAAENLRRVIRFCDDFRDRAPGLDPIRRRADALLALLHRGAAAKGEQPDRTG